MVGKLGLFGHKARARENFLTRSIKDWDDEALSLSWAGVPMHSEFARVAAMTNVCFRG